MRDKTILFSGDAGLIGSHLLEYLLNKYPNYYIINFDALIYASDNKCLDNIKKNKNYKFILGNICNNSLIQEYDISDVIHLTADSHIDNSIAAPSIFVNTNIQSIFNFLEASRPNLFKQNRNSRFLHISTDEVYYSLGNNGYFTGKSPYSAPKAYSDLLIRSYFNIPVLISNCSNNYGPKQYDKKLIPTIFRSTLQDKQIPIYRDDKNIRDGLYIGDHCAALDVIFYQGSIGESYNVGTHKERANIEMDNLVHGILDELKPSATGQSYAT